MATRELEYGIFTVQSFNRVSKTIIFIIVDLEGVFAFMCFDISNFVRFLVNFLVKTLNISLF